MTTEIDRLGARLRIGWTALLVAVGCTGTGAPEAEQGAEQGQAKVEATKAETTVGGVKIEATTAGEGKALPTTGGGVKVEAATAGEGKALPVVEGKVEPITKPEDRPGPRGMCPHGRWTGPAALAKKLKEEGSAMKGECPQYVERDGQKLSAAERAEVEQEDRQDNLPVRAIGTLDAAAMKKAAAGQCVYHWVIRCPGGRVLVGADGVVLAGVREDAAWAEGRRGERDEVRVESGTLAVLAEAWLLDARTEHASVASFARATLELMAVGAPAALVRATQEASLDEVEHARLCFGLASRYAGRELGPGPLSAVEPRAAELVRLACDVFVEGCVGETVAAVAAARAQRGCEDAAVRGVLVRIEEDEARHAALAWATLGWACARGGEGVRGAVRALAAAMRAEVLAAEDEVVDARAEALARHGRLDAAGQQACVRAAWASLIPEALAAIVGEEPGAIAVARVVA